MNQRDEHGRFLPGASGNPKGRPPKPIQHLADAAVQQVLTHDLALVRRRNTDSHLRKEALDRLSRLGAKRISASPRVEVDEAGINQIVEVLQRHVIDPDTMEAIINELETIGS